MLNSPIDTSEKDEAVARKWVILNATGQAIFSSKEENRVINRDDVMFEVMGNMGAFGLHYDMTVGMLSFTLRVQELYEVAINSAMEEAIEDFYNEL